MKNIVVWIITTLVLLAIYWVLIINNVEIVLSIVRGVCVGTCISIVADKFANWVTKRKDG